MDKIKRFVKRMPLRFSFVLYVAFFVIVAFLLTSRTTGWAQQNIYEITAKYLNNPTINEETVTIFLGPEHFSDNDRIVYKKYVFIYNTAAFFWYTPCIILSALLFYKKKLKKPLNILNSAMDKVADGELNFSIEYSGGDEMGRLCASFEKMRGSLDENTRQMLRMADERKQLNDAYTHDLRTPIAVLKGYADMIMQFGPDGKMTPDEVLDAVKTMSAHISRLDAFVGSMNTAQNLDDIATKPEPVDSSEFIICLKETADILCAGQNLNHDFHDEVCVRDLQIDGGLVQQVFENLLSNAIRFAKSKVITNYKINNDYFEICVHDDGKGFDDIILKKAGTPYNKGSEGVNTCHFGLGLYIGEALCKKHGGELIISNAECGGATAIAKFNITPHFRNI